MPLLVNLRHLKEKEIRLEGELPVAELELGIKDEMTQVGKPLWYSIDVQEVENDLLVRGELSLDIQCECVRCLKTFQYRLELDDWACLLPLEGEEKTPIDNDCVDLTPFVREDILLGFPQHPLCEADCRGLPAKETGKAKKPAPVGDSSQQEPSAWADLDKLKF